MRKPVYQELVTFLREKQIKKIELSASLSFSPPYLTQLIYGDRKMSDNTLERINRLLNTNFKHPEITLTPLPHEQLAIDRESIKEKPLFKDSIFHCKTSSILVLLYAMQILLIHSTQ